MAETLYVWSKSFCPFICFSPIYRLRKRDKEGLSRRVHRILSRGGARLLRIKTLLKFRSKALKKINQTSANRTNTLEKGTKHFIKRNKTLEKGTTPQKKEQNSRFYPGSTLVGLTPGPQRVSRSMEAQKQVRTCGGVSIIGSVKAFLQIEWGHKSDFLSSQKSCTPSHVCNLF